ncbi:hypothetical protein RJ639_028814 [Escallonia herrerae]|uniref:Reverse transcriptase Ty1/copia-type domain-containing protein n=1 Tax=Escallonia herrerae TaxID=1293975 RepID=A0AA88XLB9_9ASTE|nr:hypothetical protein RJ639_028814 [Escallonia herrerae]
MVNGLPSINQPDQLCEGCLIGKQYQHSFPKESILSARAPLELIHTYVYDPIDSVSLDMDRKEEEPIESMTRLSLASLTQSSPTSSVSSVDNPVKTGSGGKRSLEEKPIGVKWVYKVKKNSKGEVERYKARLFVKGYKQKARINYDEVFTPVVRLEMMIVDISCSTKQVEDPSDGCEVSIP